MDEHLEAVRRYGSGMHAMANLLEILKAGSTGIAMQNILLFRN